LPDYACNHDVLPPLARLIRRLHDAAADFVAPADAVWGGIPGTPPGVVPLFDTPELIAHQDYCPGNVVFRNGLPAAFIDFDLSRPTTRVADIVNAMYWWTPFMHPADRPPALRDADVPARVRIFADAYGMTQQQRALVVPTAVQRAANSIPAMRAAADADAVFRRWWVGGLEQKLLRAQQWWNTAADPIAAAIGAPARG
jgi:Ser/Thr protein kinase RdoA (MazF antagonist)